MKNLKKLTTLFFAVAVGAGMLVAAPRPKNHTVFATLPELTEIAVPNAEPLVLTETERFDTKYVPECSALTKCSKRENTFWAISDSGNAPVLFAVQNSGEIVMPAAQRKGYAGIRVTGTRNLDWECLALDERGNLIIGDVGNNLSNRRNLCFYMIPEPSPSSDVITPHRKKVSFYYPSQNEFPSPNRNYDCESCFALNGQIYFFTKHWSDTESVLWRVDPTIESYQAAVPVVRFDARGMVTDAALSPSRRRLAVLTYHGVWVFELPEAGKNGKVDEKRLLTNAPARFRRILPPTEHWQVEGIAFVDDETLLLASESGVFFRVPVKELPVAEK